MHPTLFGFIDLYTVFVIAGLGVAALIFFLGLKKFGLKRNALLDLGLVVIGTFLIGIISATLFQNLYELIQNPAEYKFTFGMTFYGGLIGGAATFILGYFLYYRRHNEPIFPIILKLAAPCITAGHAIGRIGCLFAGCCYGHETNEWYGIYFDSLGKKVVPTQLYEAIFLAILTVILLLLVFKGKFKYSLPVYMISYAIWRFLIEFVRDDPRGAFVGIFSPSQFICFFLFAGAFAVFFLEKYIFFKNEKN